MSKGLHNSIANFAAGSCARCRRALTKLAVLQLIAAIGCAPVYRPPKNADFFRAQPLTVEQSPPLHAAANPYPNSTIPLDAPGAAIASAGLPLPDGSFPGGAPPFGQGDVNGGPAGNSRQLSLEEAIQFGLGNSGVVRVLDGSGGTVAAATFYDPEIAEARARATLAAFDPNFTSALYSNWINQPPEAVFGPGLAEPTRRDEMGWTGTLSKPWVTGGESRIGYNPPLGYLYLPLGTTSFNPLYTSNIEFSLKQPLLKGAGVDVNKAPIRIAHLKRDQSIYETKQAAMASVRGIIEAYWDLQAATAASQAIDQVVPLLERVVHIEKERLAADRSVRADVAKVESQLRAVRQQGFQARSAVVQRELRLRNILGLPPNDGTVLTPTSQPLRAPVVIDPATSSDTALAIRPDLVRQRLAVRTRETELLAVKNTGLPQLDASALYRWNGVGNQLGDSLSQMFGTQYSDWQTSLTLSVPLGRRAAAANIRAATIQLCREKAVLQQNTHNVIHQVNAISQEAEYTYQLFSEAEARLQANVEWLDGAKIRYENPPPAGDGSDWLLAALNDYLLALRSQADAATDAQTFLARYNALLARLNEARGTILTDYNVQWARGDCIPPEVVSSAAPELSPGINVSPSNPNATAAPGPTLAPAEVVPTPAAAPALPMATPFPMPADGRFTPPINSAPMPYVPPPLPMPPGVAPQVPNSVPQPSAARRPMIRVVRAPNAGAAAALQ